MVNRLTEFYEAIAVACRDIEASFQDDSCNTKLIQQKKELVSGRSGGLWPTAELANTLDKLVPRKGDGPIAKLYSECLGITANLRAPSAELQIKEIYALFGIVVQEYRLAWEGERPSGPDVTEIYEKLDLLRLSVQGIEQLADAVKPPKKVRGRKRASESVIKDELKLLKDWEQARDAGVSKKEFAAESDMRLRVLDTLLRRVRKRRRDAK